MTDTARKKALYAARKSGERPLSVPAEKECSRCSTVKRASAFRRSFHNDSGLDARCNECVGDINRESLYGLSADAYSRLLRAQRGVCAICDQPETRLANHGRSLRGLAVDHDHKTGEVRGLLCANCNKAIGLMQDDPERLVAAAAYLLSRVNLLTEAIR